MITPTPGRIVHYFPDEKEAKQLQPDASQPLPAMVIYVHNNHLVNLTVFDQQGVSHGRVCVPLEQDDNKPDTRPHCAWMEYQKGQAQKTEQAQKELEQKKDAKRAEADRTREKNLRRPPPRHTPQTPS